MTKVASTGIGQISQYLLEGNIFIAVLGYVGGTLQYGVYAWTWWK